MAVYVSTSTGRSYDSATFDQWGYIAPRTDNGNKPQLWAMLADVTSDLQAAAAIQSLGPSSDGNLPIASSAAWVRSSSVTVRALLPGGAAFGSPATTSGAGTGDVVYANAKAIRYANGAGSTTIRVIVVDSSNILQLGQDVSSVTIGKATTVAGRITGNVDLVLGGGSLPGTVNTLTFTAAGNRIAWGGFRAVEGDLTGTTLKIGENFVTVLFGGSIEQSGTGSHVYTSYDGAFGFFTSGATTQYSAIKNDYTDNNTQGLGFYTMSGGVTARRLQLKASGIEVLTDATYSVARRSSTVFALANNAEKVLPTDIAIVKVTASDGSSACFALAGGANITTKYFGGAGWTATYNNAATFNLAYNGANYVVQNKSGATANFTLFEDGHNL